MGVIWMSYNGEVISITKIKFPFKSEIVIDMVRDGTEIMCTINLNERIYILSFVDNNAKHITEMIYSIENYL